MFSYNQLKEAHDQAKDLGEEIFIFLNRKLVTKFAFYLLMYIEGICERKNVDRDEEVFSFQNHTTDIFVCGQSLN